MELRGYFGGGSGSRFVDLGFGTTKMVHVYFARKWAMKMEPLRKKTMFIPGILLWLENATLVMFGEIALVGAMSTKKGMCAVTEEKDVPQVSLSRLASVARVGMVKQEHLVEVIF